MAGYKGFGSFHSDNVEDMIRIPAGEWVAPAVPAAVTAVMDAEMERARAAATSDGGSSGAIACGTPAMAAQFYLDPAWTFVNHGAFGAACRIALEVGHAWQVHCERQPLRFIDRELFPHIVHSIRCMAAEVGVPPERCVFLPNATTGFNAALRSAPLAAGDTVFLLDIAYGSMKKAVAEIAAAAGAAVVTMPVAFPVASEDDLVAQVAAAMPTRGVKLAVFDHVASNTGLVLPVAKLAALAAARGAWVLVDGAHGLQSHPLDIDAQWPQVDW
jgi:isopenicillin-N epimerase